MLYLFNIKLTTLYWIPRSGHDGAGKIELAIVSKQIWVYEI